MKWRDLVGELAQFAERLDELGVKPYVLWVEGDEIEVKVVARLSRYRDAFDTMTARGFKPAGAYTGDSEEDIDDPRDPELVITFIKKLR